MEKIIPFKKDIIFNTNVALITSISLEHTLHVESDNLINGCFVISGEYKMSDTSVNTESFSYDLPFDINMDERYILDDVVVDIDDFYYEVVNNKILSINIDVKISRLEERNIEKEIIKDSDEIIEAQVDEKITESSVSEQIEEDNCLNRDVFTSPTEEIKSLFDNIDNTSETYTTYHICIVREGESLETIMAKYNVSKEEIENYNDIKEIKLGDKLIIPTHNAQD